jgi:hypothetical protein
MHVGLKEKVLLVSDPRQIDPEAVDVARDFREAPPLFFSVS